MLRLPRRRRPPRRLSPHPPVAAERFFRSRTPPPACTRTRRRLPSSLPRRPPVTLSSISAAARSAVSCPRHPRGPSRRRRLSPSSSDCSCCLCRSSRGLRQPQLCRSPQLREMEPWCLSCSLPASCTSSTLRTAVAQWCVPRRDNPCSKPLYRVNIICEQTSESPTALAPTALICLSPHQGVLQSHHAALISPVTDGRPPLSLPSSHKQLENS